MKGSHRVIVETERMRYEFTIRRNITVILGDSATGKTTLIEFLNMYSRRGTGSGVTVQSDVPCIVFAPIVGHWQNTLTEIKGSIVFIDEGQPFIFSKEFAEAARNSDNYYVLITRRPLHNIPYSTKEIYGIRTVGKYHFPQKVYQEFYPIYDEELDHQTEKSTVLLVEDSNSGYEFFRQAFPDIRCISAGGNVKISAALSAEGKDDKTIIFADGAAFGAYIESILSIREIRKDIGLYLPESFEWLILKSGVIGSSDIPDILDHPEDYIDSSVYFSWERFFNALLEEKTADDARMRYNKIRLADYYLTDRSIRMILNVIPENIRNCLTQQPHISGAE